MGTVLSQMGLCAKWRKKEGKRQWGEQHQKEEKTPNISFITIVV